MGIQDIDIDLSNKVMVILNIEFLSIWEVDSPNPQLTKNHQNIINQGIV